jgi:hypothetical protein
MKKIGKARRIRILREQGFSAERIADMVGCSVRSVYRTLAGSPGPVAGPDPAPPTAPATPPPGAPPAGGGTLTDRVRALYVEMQAALKALAPDSRASASLAASVVTAASILARLERQPRGIVLTPAEVARARQELYELYERVRAEKRVCEVCNREMHMRPVPAPAAAAPQPERAAGVDMAALAQEVDDSMMRHRELAASSAADPRVMVQYYREATRTAALLARLEKHTSDEIIISTEMVAKARAHLGEQRVHALALGSVCAECGVTRRMRAAGA